MQTFYLLALFFLVFVQGHERHELAIFRDEVIHEPLYANTISVSVTPTVLEVSPSWVTVKISGVSNPMNNDTLAIFSPGGNIDFHKTSPIRLIKMIRLEPDKLAEYIKTGTASINVMLYNLHANVSFAIFLDVHRTWITGNNAKVLGARSNVITWKNINEPSQGRITLTKDITKMRVSWSTGRINSDQMVKIGLVSKKYSSVFRAVEVIHEASDMCGSPAIDYGWRNESRLWTALAMRLQPGQVYYYIYGSKKTGWSVESQFTATQDPSKMNETTIGIVGDQGIGSIDGTSDRRNGNSNGTAFIAEAVTKTMRSQIPKMQSVFIIGDVSYAQGFAAEWEIYHDQVRPVAERIPFMTVTGNHEADWPGFPGMRSTMDSTGECNGAYEKRYGMFMPKNSLDRNVQWYSWNQGPVHIIALSTEHDTVEGSVQYKWLVKDLQRVNRKVTPWVIIGTHRPLYAHMCVSKEIIKDLEPLLYKYKVDVLYAGHLHSYQRFCPMLNNKCTPGATTHVLVGSAGGGYHSVGGTGPGTYRPGGSTAAGFALITANRTHYIHEYLNIHNKIDDRFVLNIGYSNVLTGPYNYTIGDLKTNSCAE